MERLAPERQVLIPYAHAFNGQWSLQACSFVFPGGGPVDPLLRASNEALPRARVPRAGGDTRPPPPSSTSDRRGGGAAGGAGAKGRTLPFS